MPRPFGNSPHVRQGWEPHTSAYPENGAGGALQYMGRTQRYDPSWAFDLTNDFARKDGAAAPTVTAPTVAEAAPVGASVPATEAAEPLETGAGNAPSIMEPVETPPLVSHEAEGAPAPAAMSAARDPLLNPETHQTPFQPLTRNRQRQFQESLDNRTLPKEDYQRLQWDRRFSNRRATGVRRYWAQERQTLGEGGQGTRQWTQEQREAIQNGQRPQFNGETIQGHHRYNALDHPQIANHPGNIYPATEAEHFERWHGGSWRNDTFGQPLRPSFPEEF